MGIFSRKKEAYERIKEDDEGNPLSFDSPKLLWRDYGGFFICGLLNNFAYGVMLTASTKLACGHPPSVILLAAILPGFIATTIAPFFAHLIPYSIRVIFATVLAIVGFALPAISTTLENGFPLTILGVCLASVSSSFGEITFLAYSASYHKRSVSAYSSGTGAAGIAATGSFMLLFFVFKLTLRQTLYVMCPFPILMCISFFFVLSTPLPINKTLPIKKNAKEGEDDPLINSSHYDQSLIPKESLTLKDQLWLIVRLLPYTTPLFLVYFMEYYINNTLAPMLLFPDQSISNLRDQYFIYNIYSLLYQVGVFISRSSVELVPIRNLWIPAIAQTLNCLFLLFVVLYHFLHNQWVWLVFGIILFEGLMGGAIYVNTFTRISQDFVGKEKEFCLSATSMSYGLSITLSAASGMITNDPLCTRQPDSWIKDKQPSSCIPGPPKCD
eukprot:TRINITY_DN2900_c0_g1_i1.p1 TRINITY_DN2900_c0_g1~~TRINITY_DN2900_c0_g1_i1.p1  ORF type:complete len:441 (+),score=125.29 TRINITY_DN2900_c0_g1_i1:76-1398(+)